MELNDSNEVHVIMLMQEDATLSNALMHFITCISCVHAFVHVFISSQLLLNCMVGLFELDVNAHGLIMN